MKNRTLKNKAIFFTCIFLGFMIFLILMDKLFGFRSAPYSWGKIVHSLPFTIIGSLGFAAWVTWGGLADELIETFSNSIPKRKKKKNDEKNKK